MQNLRYKRFASSAARDRQTELIRSARGNSRFFGTRARYSTWEEVFDALNHAVFRRAAGASGC